MLTPDNRNSTAKGLSKKIHSAISCGQVRNTFAKKKSKYNGGDIITHVDSCRVAFIAHEIVDTVIFYKRVSDYTPTLPLSS